MNNIIKIFTIKELKKTFILYYRDINDLKSLEIGEIKMDNKKEYSIIDVDKNELNTIIKYIQDETKKEFS